MKARHSRREFLTVAGLAGGAALLGLPGKAASQHQTASEPPPVSAQDAWQCLREGNRRFSRNQSRHAREGADWRRQLTAAQHPFATVLGCSDSRVPPELIFDQGFGDLFVIRVAGNVIADDVIGSIEYAAAHLHTPLFVVMGHEGCGAVTAALQARTGEMSEPEGIRALLRLISPGIRDVDAQLAAEEQLKRAVEANVCWSVRQLEALPEAQRALSEKRILLVGAVYELDSGQVRWLGEA